MSGGSFNYLCYVEGTHGADEIFKRDHDVESMVTALEELSGSQAALRDTRLVLEKMATVRAELTPLLQQLSPVWKAVEWFYSCDWGKDDVVEALNQYAIAHGSIIKLTDTDD